LFHRYLQLQHARRLWTVTQKQVYRVEERRYCNNPVDIPSHLSPLPRSQVIIMRLNDCKDVIGMINVNCFTCKHDNFVIREQFLLIINCSSIEMISIGTWYLYLHKIRKRDLNGNTKSLFIVGHNHNFIINTFTSYNVKIVHFFLIS